MFCTVLIILCTDTSLVINEFGINLKGERKMIDFKIVFRNIAILEALLLLVMIFSYGRKLDMQKDIINKQAKEIAELKMSGSGK